MACKPPETGKAETAGDAPANRSDYQALRFSIIEAQLKKTGAHERYVSPEQLVRALRANAGVPLPPAVLDYVCRMLLGEIPKPHGRPPAGMDELVRVGAASVVYHHYCAWLVERKRNLGLNGWHPIRDADWWQGPPRERAARMTARALRKFWPNVDHRHIVNTLSKCGLLSSRE